MDKSFFSTSNVTQLKVRTNLLSPRLGVATHSRRLNQIIISGALATILFMVTVLNLALSQNETRESRAIASVNQSVAVSNWKPGLMKSLAAKATRNLSSVGKEPTALEKLRFGVLEGKYSFKLQDGKISEISYQESVDSDRPKYITKKDEFLKEYKGLLAVEFDSASRSKEFASNGTLVEVYQLVGQKSGSQAQIEFVSDQFGRMISMKVQQN